MADQLSDLSFAIGLGKKAAGTLINQNLVISLGMVTILVPLIIMCIAKIGHAVVAMEDPQLLLFSML